MYIDGQTHYALIRSIETVGKALKAIKKQPLIKEAQLMAAFLFTRCCVGLFEEVEALNLKQAPYLA